MSAPNLEPELTRWRKARRNVLLLLLAYIPVTIAFGMVVTRLFHTDTPVFYFGLLYIVVYVVYGLCVNRPCPRCGRTVFTHRPRGCQ